MLSLSLSLSLSLPSLSLPTLSPQLQGVVAHLMKLQVQTLTRSQSRRHCDALKLAAGTEAGFYNEKVLEYLHFVYCLCLLERLLLTRKGRELFPVKTKPGESV